MKTNDPNFINTTLDAAIFFYSFKQTTTGKIILEDEKVADFLQQVAQLKGKKVDKQFLRYDIKINGAMAIA